MGYPKAGSTFLQKQIFEKLSNYEYLSDSLKYGQINKLKEGLFYTNTNIADEKRIESFSNLLHKTIVESKRTKFIFSSEAILNFFRFNGELNLAKLSKVIKVLQQDKLIKIKLLSVIRRQDEMIHSVFSYSYDVFRRTYPNVNLFATSIEDSHFYQFINFLDYTKIQSFFNNKNNLNVHFLLFEILENNPQKFLNHVEEFFEHDINLKNLNTEPVNSNSVGDKKVLYSKKFYRLLRFHLYLKKYAVYRFLIPSKLRDLFKRNNLLNPKTFSQMNKENRRMVLEKYREANINLAKNNNFRGEMILYKYM